MKEKKQLIPRIINKLFYLSRYVISFPTAIFIFLISPFYKIKFVALFSERIGHYALNTELLLCTLETEPEIKKHKYIFYTRPSYIPLCNTQLHRMWKREIFIFPFPTIAEQIDKILKLLLGVSYSHDKIKITYEPTSGANDPEGLLRKIKTPHLKFTQKEITEGEKLTRQLGIEENAQFICLIVRDSEYLNQHLPGIDWSYHNFRNADVDNFKKAALFLAEKGYYVLRMGKFVAKSFDVQHERIIDYATHSLRSDFMDIYLLSRCHFFISTVTGLDCIPQIFRRPGLFTNVVLPDLLLPWYPNKLFIPKKINCKNKNMNIPFPESYKLLNKPLDSVVTLLNEHNLEVIQNTEDEILDAVEEIQALVNNNTHNTCSELQTLFWHYFPKKLDTNYYINISNQFVKNNPNLFLK